MDDEGRTQTRAVFEEGAFGRALIRFPSFSRFGSQSSELRICIWFTKNSSCYWLWKKENSSFIPLGRNKSKT